QETDQTWYAAGGAVNNILTFTLDAAGNQSSAANNLGTSTTTFDALNRVSSNTDVWGSVLTYSYDANSNVTGVQDSKGGTLTSVYDASNRLTSRQFSDGTTQARFDLAYNARDEMTSLTRYQDVAGTTQAGITSVTYDNVAGLVRSIYHYGGGTPAAPYS